MATPPPYPPPPGGGGGPYYPQGQPLQYPTSNQQQQQPTNYNSGGGGTQYNNPNNYTGQSSNQPQSSYNNWGGGQQQQQQYSSGHENGPNQPSAPPPLPTSQNNLNSTRNIPTKKSSSHNKKGKIKNENPPKNPAPAEIEEYEDYYEYDEDIIVPKPSSFNPCKCSNNCCSLRVNCVMIAIIEIVCGIYLIWRVVESSEHYGVTMMTTAGSSLNPSKTNNGETKVTLTDWIENPYSFPLNVTLLVVTMLAGIFLMTAAASVSHRIKIFALFHTALSIILVLLFFASAGLDTFWLGKIRKDRHLDNNPVALFLIWGVDLLLAGLFAYFGICSAGLFTQIRAGLYDKPPSESEAAAAAQKKDNNYHMTPYVAPYNRAGGASEGGGTTPTPPPLMTQLGPIGYQLPVAQAPVESSNKTNDLLVGMMIMDRMGYGGRRYNRGYQRGYGGYGGYGGGYGGGGLAGLAHGLFF